MQKKIVIVAIIAFILGGGVYFIFNNTSSNSESVQDDTKSIPTSTQMVTDEVKKVEEKTGDYSAKIDAVKGVVVLRGGSVVGVILKSKIGIENAEFVSIHAMDVKRGTFFVVVRHGGSSDFGVVKATDLSYVPLTKDSGIRNLGSGIVFSSQKKYAAFQYIKDGGECKKDLLLGVVDVNTGKIYEPSVKRAYEIGTGKWQAEMGGYRFDGDAVLQFMDMPRACDGAGDYDKQMYYSWNIESGTMAEMKF